MNVEKQKEMKEDAVRLRERIIDMQQWCAQYPELNTLQLVLNRSRYEFERIINNTESNQ